jgi:hypothetical protein
MGAGPAGSGAQRGRIDAMSGLQKIIYNGQLAAIVLANQAIIPEGLADPDERTVKAMCLYALEVAAGLQPGPYSDERALQYARRAALEAPQ